MSEPMNDSSFSSLTRRRYGFQDEWIIKERDPNSFVYYLSLLLNLDRSRFSSSIRPSSGSRRSYSDRYSPKGCPILITPRVATLEASAFSGRGYATKFSEMGILKLSTSNFTTRNIQSNQNNYFTEIPISDPQLLQFANGADLFVISPQYADDVKIVNILRNSRLIIIDEVNRKTKQQFQTKHEFYKEFLTPGNEITHTLDINAELLSSDRANYMIQSIMKLYSFTENNNNPNFNIEIKITSSATTTNWIYNYQFDLIRILHGIRILQDNPQIDSLSFILKILDPSEEGENGNKSIEAQEAA